YPTADNPAAGDMQALDVLARYAFSSSSPLYQRLVVEEQKADQLFAYFPDARDPALVGVLARVPDPADLGDVRDAIQQTLADLRTTAPDAGRIAEIKSALKYGFAARLDNSEAIAGAVVSYVAATRDVETLNEVYRAYDAITPADVQRVAQTYFTDRGLVVTTLAHGELAGAAAETGSVDDRLRSDATRVDAPSGPVAIPRRTPSGDGPTPQFEELVQTSASPLVDLRFLFAHGPADDPAGKEG